MAAVNNQIKPIRKNIYHGAGQTELNRQESRWYKSGAVAFGDASPVTLFSVPAHTLIVQALIHVSTPFDASGTSAAATATLTVPNDTGTEVIWDAAGVGLQSTGSHPSTTVGVVVPSDGSITLALTPNTTTAGQLEVYLELVEPEDLL